MKRQSMSAEDALQKVARKNHTTVEAVRREILLAMTAAMCSSDPSIRRKWSEIPCSGDMITPEELITHLSQRCRQLQGCLSKQ